MYTFHTLIILSPVFVAATLRNINKVAIGSGHERRIPLIIVKTSVIGLIHLKLFEIKKASSSANKTH
jgi:hypothetical protein